MNTEERLKKLSDALGIIALERKHPSGGYLSRTSMAQIARRALMECELEWPSRLGQQIADERQLFFEGSIYVCLTPKDLIIEINGVSHMIEQSTLKLVVSEAVCQHIEDSVLENSSGGGS